MVVIVAVESHHHHDEGDAEAFDQLIDRVGWVREPKRSLCRRAYEENPEGFAALIDEALAGRHPPSLLIWLVKRGEHRRALARRRPVVCPTCETGGGLHVDGCPEADAA
jgi:hypothetical protein